MCEATRAVHVGKVLKKNRRISELLFTFNWQSLLKTSRLFDKGEKENREARKDPEPVKSLVTSYGVDGRPYRRKKAAFFNFFDVATSVNTQTQVLKNISLL